MVKKSNNRSIYTFMKAAAALILCVIAVASVVFLTGNLALSVGSSDAPVEIAPSVSVMDAFDNRIAEAKAEAAEAARSVRKHFWLDPDAKGCPAPNQACYGQAQSAAELQWLLDEAAPLLDGQETAFNTEIEILEGSVINYYLDETILAITWKQVFDNFVYTISEVKIQDPSQFRRFIVSDDFRDLTYYQTTEMSRMCNAVVASSADFYKNRDYGIVVYDGQVKRTSSAYLLETCYININGDMVFSERRELSDAASVEKFVEDNDVMFSLAFGPILIDDGQLRPIVSYPLGEITGGYPRSALCQKDKLHYILVAATAEGPYKAYTDIPTFAENLVTFGCQKAYALDGGRTVTITMNHQLINNINYDEPRRTSDCIYFGTALPNYSDPQE